MYDDDDGYAVLREAGLRSSTMRRDMEAENDNWWVNALRREVDNEKRRRNPRPARTRVSRISAASESLRTVARDSACPMPEADTRMDLLREAAAKVQAEKGNHARPPSIANTLACSCGEESTVHGSGLCRRCYNRLKKQQSNARIRECVYRLHYAGHKKTFQMVQAMAAQHNRNVSDMIMTLLAHAAVTYSQGGHSTDVPVDRHSLSSTPLDVQTKVKHLK